MFATVIFDAIEIAIYLLLLPLIAWLGIRHGSAHSLGYIYLCLFAILRMVADVLGIHNRNSTDQNTIITTNALHSAGLSPLLLVLSAFAHESQHYLIKTTHPHDQAQALLTRLISLQGVFHLLSAGGMGLIVYAAQKLGKANDQDDIDKWQNIRKFGFVVMLLGAIAEEIYAVYVWLAVQRKRSSVKYLHLISLALCTCIGGMFVVIRALYSVVYTFSTNSDLNPVTGKFGYKLIFSDAVPFFAVMWMITGAWITRNIMKEFEDNSVQGNYLKGDGHGSDDGAGVPMVPTLFHSQPYAPRSGYHSPRSWRKGAPPV